MTTYSSIRIYISSSASILPTGFYNVVGYYGPSVSNSTNPYHIDKDFNHPIIKYNSSYYYLTYTEVDGFRPNMLDMADIDNICLPMSGPRAIYYQQRDDAHLISNYDIPLSANFEIDNISLLYTAYRTLTVQVYDNYAIETYGAINDTNGIIDTVDADFVLAATNPDGMSIVPNEGNVTELEDFEITFPYNISDVDITLLRKIALYDYNTQNVVTTIDVNSISYTLGSNKINFSLRFKVENPSFYFLYLPSGTFTYENGRTSQMTMFAYRIKGSQGGGSIYEFVYSPTSTKKLHQIKLTFYNVMNIPATRLAGNIVLDGPENFHESFACTDNEGDADDKVLFTHSGNEVFITFPETYENNTAEDVEYTITIPPNKINLQDNVWVENTLTLLVKVVGREGELPTGTDDYSLAVNPTPDSELYALSYFNIYLKLAVGISGQVELAEDRNLSEIKVLSQSNGEVDSVASANIKSQYLDEENKVTYEFDCRFSQRNNSEPTYKVLIPAGLFAITIYDGINSRTVYSGEHTVNYSIIEQTGQDGGTTGSAGFDYQLITFLGESETPSEDIAFRPGASDTILVNRQNLVRAIVKPCLTVTHLDHANGEAIISKEILQIQPGDVISVNIRATYYNSENVEVSTTSSVDYGYLGGVLSSYDLSSVFPVFRSGYPNYFRLTFIFNYNQTEIQKEIEVQVLPNFIYNNVKENINWNRTLRFDLYTGSQTERQWGCMFLTNQYDCVLNYQIPGEDENDPDITRYIAELIPTTKVRTGNLSGIYNDTFGANQPQGYGLYGENVYLTGNFYLNNGKSLVDISDDILLATGNVKEVQDRLNNLDTSVRATIEALTLRQEAFENGLDANIKNYISTNKNAVLKIGLDYSIWALGSAGIAMVNPNATYKFDPISGNYTVNEETVGDGDEYITLQGNKIAVNTYKTEYIEAPETFSEGEVEYETGYFMEVVFTTVNPYLWEYDSAGSIYIPKYSGQEVRFARGFINALPLTYATVPFTEESTNILHFVNLKSAEVTNSGYVVIGEDPTINFVLPDEISNYDNENEIYSFNSYYEDNKNRPGLFIQDTTGKLVSWTTLNDSDIVYYVPRVEQAGLFKDGKFNSKYIEAENLVAVDLDSLDDNDNQKYVKNPRFNPKLPISKETNYPVLLAEDNSAAEDANFVVISGTTGKITARGASITGTIIVGDEDAEHIKLTDNKGDEAEELGAGPSLYIKKNKDTILAQFGTLPNTDPVAQLLGTRDLYNGSTGSTPHTTVIATREEDHIEYTYIGDAHANEYGEPMGEPWYEAYVFYSQDYQQSISSDSTTVGFYQDFTLAAGERKTLKFTSGKIKLEVTEDYAAYVDTKNCQESIQICIYDGNQYTVLANQYYNIRYGTKTYTIDTTKKYMISNDSDSSKTYEIVLRLYASATGLHKVLVREYQMEDNQYVLNNSPESFSVSARISLIENINCTLGTVGYMTRILGNGLVVGYDAANYFTTYFQSPTETTSKMIFDFQSEGYGMMYDGGNVFNYVAGNRMKSYIPILQGKVDIYGTNKIPCFIGTSIFWDGRSSTYSGNNTTCTNLPYFSDKTENHFWWWREDVDDRGKPVNMKYSTSVQYDDEMRCTVDNNHHLYIASDEGGLHVILFGPEWDAALGNGFLGDSTGRASLRTTVQVSGIGIYHGETDRYLPTCGPLYATVSAVVGDSEGLQSTSRQFTVNDSNNPNPKIRNIIQVITADDATTNDGAFYITVYWCPN